MRLFFFVLLFLQIIFSVQAQNESAVPSPRNQPTVVYDSARKLLVLFGGIEQSGKFLNDVWEWNGSRWEKRIAQTAPKERAASAVAYDAHRKRLVLFGGQDDKGALADTWEWNGNVWTKIETKTAPPARVAHALVYDSKNRRLLLFGGTDFAVQKTYQDLWAWDGKNWTEIKTANAPEGRFHHAMTFDSTRNRVILFGGNAAVPPLDSDKFKAGQRNDTWEFDGKNWQKIETPMSPAKRDHHGMAYDAAARQTILFGGFSGGFADGVYLGDTWIWNGKNWSEARLENSPEKRGGKPAMIFDSASKTIYLFGGGTSQKAMNDLWQFKAGRWTQK